MHNSSDFEQQLRQLAPVPCQELTAETFYQAGWKAAQKSLAAQATPIVPRGRSAVTFASGLLSGLLVAAWYVSAADRLPGVDDRSVADTEQQVTERQIAERQVAERQESAHRESDPVESVATGPQSRPAEFAGWNSLTASLLPWHPGVPKEIPEAAPREAGPLSPAARSQWTSLVLAERAVDVRQPGTHEVVRRRQPPRLRAFPVTEEILDEWL